MILKKTLLVLGAGASIPYGFPSGHELFQKLCKLTQEVPGNWLDLLRALLDVDVNDIQQFARALQRSGLESVDAFLGRRLEHAEIGKSLLALAIAECELEEELLGVNNRDDWYRWLWKRMESGVARPEELASNRLHILTFNYDRSLEHFLFRATKDTFGSDDASAYDVVKRFQIRHVYGQIGGYGPLVEDGTRPYLPIGTKKQLQTAAEQIKVIPEARRDDDVFAEARRWFDWSEEVYFLGFGFDILNVDRLGFASVIQRRERSGLAPPRLSASSLGMTEAEITSHLARVSNNTGGIYLEEGCRMFLRRVGGALS